MSIQEQRRYDEDAVRSAFTEHGPFSRQWFIPDEDLEAYLDAEYNTSDDSESAEGVEGCETSPLLAAGDRTTSTPPRHNGEGIRQQVLERCYPTPKPRKRTQDGPISNRVGSKCMGLGGVAFVLILLAIIYHGLPALKAMLFPEDQGATQPVGEPF